MDSKKSILYSEAYSNFENQGPYELGPISSFKMRNDPQYIMFQMSRYKHAARLISNKKKVMDIGSGDGIGLPILCQYYENVSAIDIDESFLKNAKKFLDPSSNCKFILNNFFNSPLSEKFDAGFCFDVLSLINPNYEKIWFENICKSLTSDGILVIGTQNKNTTIFGNPKNHKDQPNFKTFEELNITINNFFQNTLILSMNDETIHTGKRESAQYFIGFGINPRKS